MFNTKWKLTWENYLKNEKRMIEIIIFFLFKNVWFNKIYKFKTKKNKKKEKKLISTTDGDQTDFF